MTAAISGRPARCLANRFTALAEGVPGEAIPDYPIAYDAGKALHAAARAAGEFGYGAQTAPSGPGKAPPSPARFPRPSWSPASAARWKRLYRAG
jgi:nitronate monooxygenase